MAKFRCNLSGTRLKDCLFVAGVFETSDIKQIEYLRAYGAQQGCIVTEVVEDAVIVPEAEPVKEIEPVKQATPQEPKKKKTYTGRR